MKATGTRTGIIAGIALALVAALMLSTNMLAQPRFRGLDGPFMGGGPRGMLPGLRALDLTDAQREEIRGVADQNRDAGRQLRERLGAARGRPCTRVLISCFPPGILVNGCSEALDSSSWRPRSPCRSRGAWSAVHSSQAGRLLERSRSVSPRAARDPASSQADCRQWLPTGPRATLTRRSL